MSYVSSALSLWIIYSIRMHRADNRSITHQDEGCGDDNRKSEVGEEGFRYALKRHREKEYWPDLFFFFLPCFGQDKKIYFIEGIFERAWKYVPLQFFRFSWCIFALFLLHIPIEQYVSVYTVDQRTLFLFHQKIRHARTKTNWKWRHGCKK